MSRPVEQWRVMWFALCVVMSGLLLLGAGIAAWEIVNG